MEIEQNKQTEQQLIEFVRDNGYPNFSPRQLKRFRQEKVVPGVCVDHLGFGPGTRTLYSLEAGTQVLAVCQLLEQTRKFDVVRFQLWRAGYSIPLLILKETIRQLVPQLNWEIPRRESQKYNAVERWLSILMQKMSGRFFRFLLKRFGKNLEHLQSFFEIMLNLLYGIRVPFDEPSHYKGELSATDIFAQGLNLEELWFLPKDLAADFQHASDKGLFSITKMNMALEGATEEDLKRANARIEVVALIFEWLDLMGFLPKPLRSLLLRDIANPSFQALLLPFVLHLEKKGYANNMDQLLEVFRVQVPKFRAFRALYFALQRELPIVAKELDTVEDIWRLLKNRSEQEREQYFAQKNEHLHAIYLQNQTEVDAFWQRHPEIKSAIEAGDTSSPRPA